MAEEVVANLQKMTGELGMVGLGVMGRNLLLNMADCGFAVAGFDQDAEKVAELSKSFHSRIQGSEKIKPFIDLLRCPRAVMLLVPAGPPVDAVIADLLPLLEPGDLIIDAGNSYYKDTNRRAEKLAEKKISFLGIGVSGGEEGARRGPSMMPGGPIKAYERVSSILEAAAAKVDGEPCVAYLGPGSAGHFVKMVHNGIEYGIMELIAETYDLMKRGLELTDDELHAVYAGWNEKSSSYLLEITSHIFLKVDVRTGRRLIDVILDVAKQKGTGMWTSQSAMELGVATPTIDSAVNMRNLSILELQRAEASLRLQRPIIRLPVERAPFLKQLGQAFEAAMIITFAQGMALLKVASEKLNYQFQLDKIARIWRGGCIIRAELLEGISAAYQQDPALPNLLLDPELAKRIMENEEVLRRIIGIAAQGGIPIPALMSALGYMDSYRSGWLPANLIQAQRDYFGAHTYERLDDKGAFHTQWE